MIVIAGVAALIGNIWRIGVMGGVMMLVVSLCGYALWALLVVLIGTKLMPEPTTKADFNEGFRVMGFTAAPGIFNVLAIIPFLGPLISFVIWIWMIVVGVVAVGRCRLLEYRPCGHRVPDCRCRLLDCHDRYPVPLLVGSFIIEA